MRIQLYELTRAGPITKTAVRRVEKSVELYVRIHIRLKNNKNAKKKVPKNTRAVNLKETTKITIRIVIK